MTNYRQLLERTTQLQGNAQSNLPVIPNNGNPRGVYNLASGGSAARTPDSQLSTASVPGRTGPYSYDWLQPSPSIGRIRSMLDQPVTPALTGPLQTGPRGYSPAGVPHDVSGRIEGEPTTPVLPQGNGRVSTVGEAFRRIMGTEAPVMPTASSNPNSVSSGYTPPVIPNLASR